MLCDTGDALPKPCPQLEQAEKHSSCSSLASEPTGMEPKKFTSQANKNAAELKPVSFKLLHSSSTTVQDCHILHSLKVTQVLLDIGVHNGNSRDEFQWQTGLPTNYRKADALPQKDWNSSLKFVVFRHCFEFAKNKPEPPEVLHPLQPKFEKY